MAPAKAALVEIFDSIQGEGRFVGVPMAFVRVATCPLRCTYCDTPHSYAAAPQFAVHVDGEVRREPNPVTAERAARLVREAIGTRPVPHPVSVTGGEPLVVPEFVRALGEALGTDHPLHLETAAHDPNALRACLPAVRHLSADYKLPETVQGRQLGAEHVACAALALAHGGITVDVKVVLTADVGPASFARALADLQPVRTGILLVLQPVTPFGAVTAPLPAERLHGFRRQAVDAGFTVRVLPQVHRLLGVP